MQSAAAGSSAGAGAAAGGGAAPAAAAPAAETSAAASVAGATATPTAGQAAGAAAPSESGSSGAAVAATTSGAASGGGQQQQQQPANNTSTTGAPPPKTQSHSHPVLLPCPTSASSSSAAAGGGDLQVNPVAAAAAAASSSSVPCYPAPPWQQLAPPCGYQPPHGALLHLQQAVGAGMMASLRYHQHQRQQRAIPASSVFGNQKLRSGKWLKEEEEYAESLICLFERGRLADCENGWSLRSYLSRKLNCPPMRISKKYAGKGIGKMVYLSKAGGVGSNDGDGDDVPAHEIRRLEADAQGKEQRFYRACLPCLQFFQAPFAVPSVAGGPTLMPAQLQMFQGNYFPYSNSAASYHPSAAAANAARFGASVVGGPQVASTTTGQVLAPSGSVASVAPTILPAAAPTRHQQPQGTTAVSHSGHGSSSGSAHQAMMTVDDQRSELRKSYLRALEAGNVSMTTSSSTRQDVSSSAGNVQRASGNSSQTSAAAPAAPQQAPLPWRPADPLHSAPVYVTATQNAPGQTLQAVGASAGTAGGTNTAAAFPQAFANGMAIAGPAPGAATSSTDASPPDFLSGFDKNAALPGAKAPFLTHASAGCGQSAPFLSTSKSFDDFHRSLGMDPASSVAPLQVGPRLPDGDAAARTSAAFNADSYALFAAESAAVAASQHAAYLPTNGVLAGDGTNSHFAKRRNGSFDHSGVVKLVAEHVGLRKSAASAPPPAPAPEPGADKSVGNKHQAPQPKPPELPNSSSQQAQQMQQSVLMTSMQTKALLERLRSSMGATAVSASEPSATESSSSAPQSGTGSSDNGSSNESNENDTDESSGNNSDGLNSYNTSEGSSDDSGMEDEPKKKKQKMSTTPPHDNKTTAGTVNRG